MKVGVIGGKGFLGTNLCEALVREGHSVRVFDKSQSLLTTEVESFHGDYTKIEELLPFIEGCETIFHFGCTTLPESSNRNVVYDFESNVIASIRLFEACKKFHVRKIIFASSGGTVYGKPITLPISESHPTNPICAYGINKLIIEKYLELFRQQGGSDYIVFRISNPFGPNQNIDGKQGAISIFLNKIIKNEPIEIWGDGLAIRDYIYISDVVDAMLSGIFLNGSRILNLGSGVGHSLNEVIALIEEIVGVKAKKTYRTTRSFDVPANILDISCIRKTLEWNPKISLTEGIMSLLSTVKIQKKIY